MDYALLITHTQKMERWLIILNNLKLLHMNTDIYSTESLYILISTSANCVRLENTTDERKKERSQWR